MKKLSTYRILTFILLPIAILFAFFSLMLLFVALANPPMLLPLFVVTCVVIYIFTSFKFLNKGILQTRPCKPSLKDWIKVNAIVSIVFTVIILLNTGTMMMQPELMSQAIDNTIAMQGSAGGISKEKLLEISKVMMYALGVISIILLVHIFISFRLLKAYKHVFENSTDNP